MAAEAPDITSGNRMCFFLWPSFKRQGYHFREVPPQTSFKALSRIDLLAKGMNGLLLNQSISSLKLGVRSASPGCLEVSECPNGVRVSSGTHPEAVEGIIENAYWIATCQ